MRFRFYVKDCVAQPRPNHPWSEADGIALWQPSLRRILPPDAPRYPFLAFWLFHQLRMFKNRDYGVLFIKADDRVVQRCCLLPRFFRYPFMQSGDLNVSTWTHPDYRRRGLAARTLQKAIACSGQPFRRIWYITRESNAASMGLAEGCEFVLFATGKRVTTFGSRILGRFVVETLQDGICPDLLRPDLFERISDRISEMIKRWFDMLSSAAGLILMAPVLGAIALAVKLGSPGPVFYRGLRAGRRGQPFRLLKFRTMVTNADRIGGPSSAADDPRITRLGGFLRRYKLDELPQLVNVLRGEMSLVGPRPEVVQEVLLYTEEERRLLEVRPGITDWASIRFRNEGEILRGSADPHAAYRVKIRPEKIRLGLEYVERRSFWTDCKIILNTLKAIRE